MASLLKVPSAEARKLLEIEKYNLSVMSRTIGIPKSTLIRYLDRGLETAPLWAVCRIIKYLKIPDEDRLKLIRIFSGEKS